MNIKEVDAHSEVMHRRVDDKKVQHMYLVISDVIVSFILRLDLTLFLAV